MKLEEFESNIKQGDPITLQVLQNGRYDIGTVEIFPHRLLSAIQDLVRIGEIKLFLSKSEEDAALEMFRKLAPNPAELSVLIDGMKQLGKKPSNDELTEGFRHYFENADSTTVRRRLEAECSRLIVAAMHKNLEGLLSNALLLALSVAQTQAEALVRSRLGLKKLKAEEIREFIFEPTNELIKVLFSISRGGDTRSSKGVLLSREDRIQFAKLVDSHKQQVGKGRKRRLSLWDLAYKELVAAREKGKDKVLGSQEYEGLPRALLIDALEHWILAESCEMHPLPDKKPKAYLYRQCLLELGLDADCLAASTLDRKYYEGRALMRLESE